MFSNFRRCIKITVSNRLYELEERSLTACMNSVAMEFNGLYEFGGYRFYKGKAVSWKPFQLSINNFSSIKILQKYIAF